MSALGVVHTVFAVVAMVAGGAVFLVAKGTRWHRTLGHVYVTAMVGLVASAFFIYDLFGGFGPFHLAAVAVVLTVGPGMAFVLLRRPRGSWMGRHAGWMTGSYIGLWCAFAAESTTRWILPPLLPSLPEDMAWPLFWAGVGVAAGVTGWIGGTLRSRFLPRSLERTPAAMRRERAALRERVGEGMGPP